MLSLDLALRYRVIPTPARVPNAVLVQSAFEFGRHIGRAVIRQQARSMAHCCAPKATAFECKAECVGNAFRRHATAQLPDKDVPEVLIEHTREK